MPCKCCGAKCDTRYCAECKPKVEAKTQELTGIRRPIVSGGHNLRGKKV